MRAFASGLGASSDASPARLIHLSPNAAKLLSAYRSDPSWSTESLSAMERGGTAAKALIGWATQLEKVYREQPRVQKFLRCAEQVGISEIGGECDAELPLLRSSLYRRFPFCW